MCYYHQHACLLVYLSLWSVNQTSMDDSDDKRNTGQLLNSRVLLKSQFVSLMQSYPKSFDTCLNST